VELCFNLQGKTHLKHPSPPVVDKNLQAVGGLERRRGDQHEDWKWKRMMTMKRTTAISQKKFLMTRFSGCYNPQALSLRSQYGIQTIGWTKGRMNIYGRSRNGRDYLLKSTTLTDAHNVACASCLSTSSVTCHAHRTEHQWTDRFYTIDPRSLLFVLAGECFLQYILSNAYNGDSMQERS